MKKLNKNEQQFAELLTQKQVDFIPKQVFWYNGEYIVPDFYLSKQKVYCELVTGNLPLDKKKVLIGKAIKDGHKFTFCHLDGSKHIFSAASLKTFNLTSNKEFFSLYEINRFYYKNEHIILSDKSKTVIKLLYANTSMTQEDLAKEFEVSQSLISKIIKKGGEKDGIR